METQRRRHCAGMGLLMVLSLWTVCLAAGEHVCEDAEKVQIADNGKALVRVVVAKGATNEARSAGEQLADILKRISDADFTLAEDDGVSGIAVGMYGDFPAISVKPSFDANDPGESQGYEIQTHANGVHILAASPLALPYAVNDFLGRFGYRRFFPTPNWEIVPKRTRLELGIHIREVPDYYTRRIWAGYGMWPEFREDATRWDAVNRNGGYALNTGHAYDGIISANKKAFEEHPEYYGLLNGSRTSSKLCIANRGLRALVADFAVGRFEKDPALKSFSVDPSDGGGWCECEECLKLGSPSTRAVLLANTVAEAVRQRFPGRRVGMYAYNKHSPPPAIEVDPDVVISVATAFIAGGISLDEILEGWRKKRAVIGIREYYDVCIWSSNLPGRSRGSNLDYLKTTIPRFHQQGARYMSAESSDDWGPSGLGYYLASKMLWNVKESENLAALTQDFLDQSFGAASSDMMEFYRLLDGSKPKPLCADLVGRMYRLLEAAGSKVSASPEIKRRIHDLVLYTRYCELYLSFAQSTGTAQVDAFDQLMEFVAAIRHTRMVHSKGLFRESARLCPPQREKPAGDWQKAGQFTDEQVERMLSQGVAANKLLDFETVSFSEKLVPPTRPPTSDVPHGPIHPRRGRVTYYTWVDESRQPLELTVTGGLIAHYRNRGNVKFELWKLGGSTETGELETLVQKDDSVPPDGVAHSVKLTPREPGLYKIIINDGSDMTRVEWPRGRRMTIAVNAVTPPSLDGDFYLYVPKGAKVLGFFCNAHRGQIVRPDGVIAFTFNTALGHYSIPIPPGTDGKIWKLQNISGKIGLMTVPPWCAFEPAGLLLPEDAVKKDEL